MATTNQNFEMWQGEDKRITFNVTSSNGQEKSLVGCSVKWVLMIDGRQSIIKSTTLSNIIIIGNSAQVILDSIDTNKLSGMYKHELRVTDLDNISEVCATGNITILESITK